VLGSSVEEASVPEALARDRGSRLKLGARRKLQMQMSKLAQGETLVFLGPDDHIPVVTIPPVTMTT
jgi:hypothetical protein